MSREPVTTVLSLADGREIDIDIRRSNRARRILLHVGTWNGRVELVLPPGASRREALGFAHTQTRWLARQLDRIMEPVPFEDGGRFPLFDDPVTIRRTADGSAVPMLAGSDLIVGGTPETLPGRVRRWIRTRALSEIAPRAKSVGAGIGRTPNRISMRDTRSRWGSCSREGNLNFSWRLVMAPEPVLDYVIAHEVAHLRHLNHGPRFWSLVETICPDHAPARAWLRRHGAELHRYGRE